MRVKVIDDINVRIDDPGADRNGWFVLCPNSVRRDIAFDYAMTPADKVGPRMWTTDRKSGAFVQTGRYHQ